MSQEMVSPSEGPGDGPEKELTRERSPFLPDSHGACDRPNGSLNPERATRILGPTVGSREDTSAMEDLIKTQPQPLHGLSAAALEPSEEVDGILQGRLSNGNGMPPAPVSHKVQHKLRSSLSVHSQSSSSGSHKPGTSPEDCCVHCILACLFCQFLSLCDMVVAQTSCGACSSEACCCCCCADDLGDDCGCPCDADCGIMDACCESSDCLEICMECCGICFPT